MDHFSIESAIFDSAYKVHQKYVDRDLANNGHEIWLLAGECLRTIVIPFDRHPLACRVMKCFVDYYCDRYREAHAA